MNLSDEEFEKELASLKPVVPSPSLQTQIKNDLESKDAQSSGKLIRFWPVIALASAACLVLVLKNSNSDPAAGNANSIVAESVDQKDDPSSQFASYQPVEAEQRLIEAIDDGVILTADNEPVRRLRYQFIDSVTMIDQSDGSVFTIEIPREETLFVPVSLL